MLLAVDVGNSQTVFGLFDQASLEADWRIATRRDSTFDEMGVLLRALFDEAGFRPQHVDGMIVSSVVPELDDVLRVTGTQ